MSVSPLYAQTDKKPNNKAPANVGNRQNAEWEMGNLIACITHAEHSKPSIVFVNNFTL